MEKDWLCVLRTHESFQAEIAKEILENEEINCVIIHENDSSFPSVVDAEVWVHKDFEAKASELLKDLKN